jgi:hypothetical protein
MALILEDTIFVMNTDTYRPGHVTFEVFVSRHDA